MRIVISGSTGFVGSRLVSFLRSEHDVVHLARKPTPDGLPCIIWDPDRGILPAAELEGVDVVIHLAGANVAERWTDAHKAAILNSRVTSARLLCATLAKLQKKPKVLLSASGVGYYGAQEPDVVLDEASPLGGGFLADVCRQWEAETRYAQEAGIRVVHMRLGVVLGKGGGALRKMWTPFQMGLGGVLGSGRQMMSWIALEEIPFIVAHLIKSDKLNGAVNIVSPHPVSNREFTRALGHAIRRPTVFPVPAIMIKLLFGEMGTEMLLKGSTVLPNRLQNAGYTFRYPDIQSALEKVAR